MKVRLMAWRPTHEPTAEEIERETEIIRLGWSARTENYRSGGDPENPYTIPTVTRISGPVVKKAYGDG